MPRIRPLAVALICDETILDATFLTAARTAIAATAHAEGYAVTEILEVAGRNGPDRSTLDGLIDLARRVQARAILVFGDINDRQRTEIAIRSGLSVLPTDGCPLPDQAAGERAPAWIGRVSFELRNGYGWRVAALEVAVHRDTLDLWRGDRILAVMDRDRFTAWLTSPEQAYQIDDALWSVHGDDICLTIEDSVPHPVSRALHLLSAVLGAQRT